MDHAALSVSAPERPASDVSPAVGWVGLAALGLWVLVCREWAFVADLLELGGPRMALSGPYAALAALLVTSLAMMAWSLAVDKVHRRGSTGIDWSAPRGWRAAAETGAVKLVGLWATWALIGFFYCLFRYYWQGQYIFALRVIGAALVPMVVLSVPYVWWLDRVLIEPRDGAWHFGGFVMGREADQGEILRHLRRWGVKGFFTAFMVSILPAGFAYVVEFDLSGVMARPADLANGLIGLLFMVDVQIGTVGYLLTLRPLDSHIRSANPHLDGWLAALICYPPFVLMGGGGVLDYHPATAEWSAWLAASPALLWLWGGVLVALTAVYAWATVAFGIRFSNLTYRGIITHGPYCLTRHPAYVSKNAFWWLSTMPFLATSGSAVDCIRNTCILALVSATYYWRARTEERHLLAEDAKYRAYHAWAEQGAPVTRWVGRILGPAAL